ncbi:YesL family protein [Faecalibaculum rodentium]|jgi:uncharacterized membrane protein YesL|uniref:YesL family protein n=1 Tax=Faecalibaculum rodentium TaxID=1702221 RepID=UPI00248C0719|nr:YesL family protein [Faecalibaculum rodentium]
MKLNYESGWMQTLTWLGNLLIVNVCFVIGCLPLVTIGTSVCAAFAACLKMADGTQSGLIQEFWKSYKASLKNGILLELFILFFVWCLWLNWQIAFRLQDPPLAASLCLVGGCVLLAVHTLYAFALEARYSNSLYRQLINSRKLCQRFFLRTLMLAVSLGLLYLLFVHTSPLLAYIGLFIGPALTIYTASSIVWPIFRQIEADSMATDGFSVAGN